MSVYIDTSVLVSAVLNEANSPQVRAWWKRLIGPVIVSDLASLEFSAVISRAVRTGQFSNGDAEIAIRGLDQLRIGCDRVSHAQADYIAAEQLVRDYATKLAAADALHLATAIRARAALATFDVRLEDAARSRGVEIELVI